MRHLTFLHALLIAAVVLAGCGDSASQKPDVADDPAEDAAVAVPGEPECAGHVDCDDGLFCTGTEICEQGRCMPGNVVTCDDGIGCTVDVCDEDGQACRNVPPDQDADGYFDLACLDADGIPLGNDCNDLDENTFPGNPEVCDAAGHDEDCDPTTFGETDVDGDGFVDAACCNRDDQGVAICGDDCDDSDESRHPTLPEVCDGIDNDCNGNVDEGVLLSGFRDMDGDMYGDERFPIVRCPSAEGFAIQGGDCDDMNVAVSPQGTDICDGLDNDCDGSIDEGVLLNGFADLDGDRFGDPNSPMQRCGPGPGFSQNGDDCDDTDRRVYRDHVELCDDKDNDCDGSVDEGLLLQGFADLDGDLHGDPNAPIEVCVGAPRFSFIGDDCDDTNNRVHGSQVEICDQVDNDCDGFIDENAIAVTWYRDADGDNFGNVAGGTLTACIPPDGYSLLPTDCDDSSSGIGPLAIEACDGLDNDCNGFADYEISPGNYEDDDRDGYLDAACALLGEDCDDDDARIHPDAPNLCDGRDTDCDGTVDDGQGSDWYEDIDQDNFGNDAVSMSACEPPLGFVLEGGDCDDTDATKNPGVVDLCNGIDNDCDTLIDEDAIFFEAYVDTDGDGAGTGAAVMMCVLAEGYGLLPVDCEADDPLIYDGQDEICDNIDNDCDQKTDEDAARECDLPQAVPVCITGECAIESCIDDYGDCDNVAENGCEIDTLGDPSHCGGCGQACGVVPNAAGVCAAGVCDITCDAGYVDCDGMLDTGCEANFGTDPNNCGGCGNRCSERANADSACESAICTISCQVGYTSCDNDELTGCEVNTGNDTENCGSCGNMCNAGEICAAGSCLVPPYGGDGNEGDFMPQSDVVIGSGVHQYASIYIPAGVTVTVTPGSTGVLDLRATGDVIIDGVIDVSGGAGGRGGGNCRGSIAGGGGATGDPLGLGSQGGLACTTSVGGLGTAGLDGAQVPNGIQCGSGGQNGGGSGGSEQDAGGGGGGGFAGGGGGGGVTLDSLGDGASILGLSQGGLAGERYVGGQGGQQDDAAYAGQDAPSCVGALLGAAGGGGSIGAQAAADYTVDVAFFTGSGGGGGGATGCEGGAGGGGGGGALRITSPSGIWISGSGALLANGGAGGLPGGNVAGAGGGGSGGVIYLSAPTISNDGNVHAGGGIGGRRSANTCGNGGDGGIGRIRLSVLPEKCGAQGSYIPPLDGSCEVTGNYTPATAYIGLYPY